jgi:hypothetical protein
MKLLPNMKIYQHMNSLGIEHFKIELIETYSCNSKDELRAREGYWIKSLGAGLNRVIAGRTKKQYAIDNKDRIQIQYKSKCLCECGKSYTVYHRLRHFKSQYHNFHSCDGISKIEL